MNKHYIKSIAYQARKDIENIWITRNGDCDLLGACGVASWHLMCLLRNNTDNIYIAFCDGPGHCWVEINNKYVLDITATQFSNRMPRVVFVLKSTYYKYNFVIDELLFIKFTNHNIVLKKIKNWTWLLSDKDFLLLKKKQ